MSNPPPSDPPPEEFAGAFTLSIGINWFLDKFCRGIHGFAVVSKSYGDYLRGLDPTEQTLHVDYADNTNTICHVYPIHVWREAVRRWNISKATAELDRQARFAKEAEAKELELKYAQREAEIKRVTILFSSRFPGFINKNSAKLIRAIVINSLQGRTKPEIQKSLSIDAATIEDFTALPQPELSEEELLMGLVKEPAKPAEDIV